MKILKSIQIVFIILIQFSCSKDSDTSDSEVPEVKISTLTNTSTSGFKYKVHFQETAASTNRKGLVVLAHGLGGSENDPLINEQCIDLAQLGYVAVTTSYTLPGTGFFANVNAFKTCMEEVIIKLNTDYAISVNKTILGGTSQGGNLAYFMFLPAANGASPTTLNLKGAALMCAGADTYRGQNITKPTALMCNKIDDAVGIINAYDFKNALQNNVNPDVKALSECLIFDNNNQNGHCTNANEYKAFLIKKVKEWLP